MQPWTWADSSAYAAVTLSQVKNALALLPSPYLHNGLMVVINQTTQMVDSTGRPVPLSEVLSFSFLACTSVSANHV